MATVAAANGQLTPPTAPSPSAPSAQKRKHEDTRASRPGTRIQQTQRDLLQVLRPLDTSPSFLEFELEDDTINEPVAKKARTSEPARQPSNLANKLRNGSYPTLQMLKEDVARVCNALTKSIQYESERQEARDGQPGRSAIETLKQIQRIEAYAKMIDDFLSNETQHEGNDGSVADPVKLEDAVSASLKSRLNEETTKRIGTVLTLFGNAPTPKQLFSSMPNSSLSQETKAIKTELPVDEMSLPNGLSATNILPSTSEASQKGPNFEETFAPPQSLPALQPPRPTRTASTRDGSLIWEFKDSITRDSKKGSWTLQNQSASEWLSYGEGHSKVVGFDPGEKRKQRDRALSSGGEIGQNTLDQAALDAALAREEEALFRRAYSSFAPSRDETTAVIPEEAKSMLWWTKLGSAKYASAFALDPALFDGETTQKNMHSRPSPVGDTELAQAVELYEEGTPDYAEPTKAPRVDVDDALREVSQLLESLASHQRIRNATLPSNPSSRNPVSPGLSNARTATPDTPGDDEIAIYDGLRHELAYLVLKLPPYALAKLDGDQLGQLGVSTLLNYKTKDTRGTLEEDLATRLAKYHASAAAAGVASLNRGGSSSGQHYNTTAQRTPAIGQAANTRYGQQYGASRTPATAPQFHRSGSSSSYNASRPSYGQATMYARPSAPQQSYTHQGSQQYSGQRPQPQPHANYAGYGQQYGQSMQGRPNYPSSQPLAQYQQRSHSQTQSQNAVSYQAGASPAHMLGQHAAGSPVKGGYPTQFSQPLHHNHQQQPSSGRSTPNNYPSQPQTPINGFQHRPTVLPRPPSATPQTNGI